MRVTKFVNIFSLVLIAASGVLRPPIVLAEGTRSPPPRQPTNHERALELDKVADQFDNANIGHTVAAIAYTASAATCITTCIAGPLAMKGCAIAQGVATGVDLVQGFWVAAEADSFTSAISGQVGSMLGTSMGAVTSIQASVGLNAKSSLLMPCLTGIGSQTLFATMRYVSAAEDRKQRDQKLAEARDMRAEGQDRFDDNNDNPAGPQLAGGGGSARGGGHQAPPGITPPGSGGGISEGPTRHSGSPERLAESFARAAGKDLPELKRAFESNTGHKLDEVIQGFANGHSPSEVLSAMMPKNAPAEYGQVVAAADAFAKDYKPVADDGNSTNPTPHRSLASAAGRFDTAAVGGSGKAGGANPMSGLSDMLASMMPGANKDKAAKPQHGADAVRFNGAGGPAASTNLDGYITANHSLFDVIGRRYAVVRNRTEMPLAGASATGPNASTGSPTTTSNTRAPANIYLK